MMKDNFVDIYKSEEDSSLKEIVENYRNNQLEQVTSPTHSVEESHIGSV
jgi:predicted Fe-Mo cluster-binding NifX family protein